MKSVQKKLRRLQNTGSEFFDEAYFIIKDRAPGLRRPSDSEMIREANRIVNENLISGYFRRQGVHTAERGARLRIFLSGAGCGTIIGMIICFIAR